MIRTCVNHGETDFVLVTRKGRNPAFQCVKCRSDWVTRSRTRLKDELVAEAGGKCVICGYDRSTWALQFDHTDASNKLNNVSILIRNGRRAEAREEVKKCQLLCANCHAEVGEQRYLRSLGVLESPA